MKKLPKNSREIKEFFEKNDDLTHEQINDAIKNFFAEEEKKSEAERNDLKEFSKKITHLSPKEKAYAFIDYFYHKYSTTFGEDELLILLISRGKSFKNYQSSQYKIWKAKSKEKIEEAGYSYTNHDTGEQEVVRYVDKKDLLNQDVEKSSTFEIPNFWAGKRNEANTIDATMLRVAQWCKILGFEGYWKRLVHDIELTVPYEIETRYQHIQWLYSICRSEYGIDLMYGKLSLLIEICTIPKDSEVENVWHYVYYDLSKPKKEIRSSAFIAAGVIFSLIRLGKREQHIDLVNSAKEYLIKSQLEDGSWKPFSGLDKPSIETTALCIHALALADFPNCNYVIENGADWLYKQQDIWGLWFEEENPYVNSDFLTVLVLDAIEIAEGNFDKLTFDYNYTRRLAQATTQSEPLKEEQVQIFIEHMGDKYSIDKSQVGSIGPKSNSTSNTFQQINHSISDGFDFNALSLELEKLKSALKAKAEEPEEFVSISYVAEAEKATKQKDYGKVVESLKAGGKWVYETAKEIGVNIAASIISKQLE